MKVSVVVFSLTIWFSITKCADKRLAESRTRAKTRIVSMGK
jgi:hypothetical protein